MLLKIKDIPKNIKSGKILLWNKIPKNCGSISGFPTEEKEIEKNTISLKTEKFMSTCWILLKTCLDNDGYGIAGPQVMGISKKVFLIREDEDTFRIYFHPSWTPQEGAEIVVSTEGCLSVPKKELKVPRFASINAKWYELSEEGFVVEKNEVLSGMRAWCYQHEASHLLGRSILDDSMLETPFFSP